jgi:hypothetical protein
LEFVLRIVIASMRHAPGALFPQIEKPAGAGPYVPCGPERERYMPCVYAAERLRDATIIFGGAPRGLGWIKTELWRHRNRCGFHPVVTAYTLYQERAA